MENKLVVTNLPNDDCDILVEYKENDVVKVTDCEGNTLKLNKDQEEFVKKEIEALNNNSAINTEEILA